MIHAALRLCLGLFLVFGLAGSVQAAPVHLAAPVHQAGGGFIAVDESPIGGLNDIFNMEPPHLLFLGAGIIAGAALIAPGLAVNDLLGVAIGVIGSEYLYQTFYEFPQLVVAPVLGIRTAL